MKHITIVLACALLMLTGCQDSAVERGAWVPALEDTGFSHLKTAGDRLQASLSKLQSDLSQEKVEDARQEIEIAQKHIRALVYYDIPVTEIRQLVYDAGRLHALNRHDATLEHLNRADHLLGEIETHGNASLHQALQEPRVMIEKLRETLEQERQTTSTKYLVELSHSAAAQFSDLGHKVNMMAVKGDLILSGVEFNQTNQDSK
ncbi:MAG: hypothetical protein RQ754_16375 [Desulfuromonadales bacterium]|nr:hypothetical protein [Desulfuromonadales bacterium]